MSNTDLYDLGTYHEGGIPPPLVVTFEDENGSPLDLSAFETGRFERRPFGGTVVESAAAVSPATSGPTMGQVTYTWVAADMVAGTWLGEIWAIDAPANRFVSRKLTWFVEPAIAVPA